MYDMQASHIMNPSSESKWSEDVTVCIYKINLGLELHPGRGIKKNNEIVMCGRKSAGKRNGGSTIVDGQWY